MTGNSKLEFGKLAGKAETSLELALSPPALTTENT